jgi:hypothetical protein
MPSNRICSATAWGSVRPVRPGGPVLAYHHHRAVRVRRDGQAHRAHGEPDEAAEPPAAEHHHARRAGLLAQRAGGRTAQRERGGTHRWVVPGHRAPRGVVQRPLRLGHAAVGDLVEHVHQAQLQAAPARLGQRPAQGRAGRGQAVVAHHDRVLGHEVSQAPRYRRRPANAPSR